MKQKLVSACYLIVGLINFAPLMGVLGQARLSAMYGLGELSPDLLLLMQHRAVLFGIIGGLILWSVFKTSLRPIAAVAGFISMITYLVLAFASDGIGDALSRIATIDTAAIALLAGAVLLSRADKNQT